MTSFLVLIFIILGSSANKYFLLSPEDQYLSHLDSSLPSCAEEESPDNVLDGKAQNRLSGFKLSGTYQCQRNIFEYKERNSFVDYVTEHEVSRAQGVAQKLRAWAASGLQKSAIAKHSKNNFSLNPIALEIHTDIPELRSTLQATFTQELTTALGPESVRREFSEKKDHPILKIQVQRLQDPVDFLKVTLIEAPANGESERRSL